jgi:transforming growth factor-beta-induced protein
MATILQIANADRNLSFFSKGLRMAGLEEKLNETGPYTLLGPVNLAFEKFASFTADELFLPANRNELLDLLSSHVLKGKFMLSDFVPGRKFMTINDKEVSVTLESGDVHLNQSKILSKDRQGKNGVVHSLNKFYQCA